MKDPCLRGSSNALPRGRRGSEGSVADRVKCKASPNWWVRALHASDPKPAWVPTRTRLLLSVGIGVALGWKAARTAMANDMPRDFDQLWFAARALLAGQNPYHLVGPGRSFPWEFPLFYPLP